jgi:hypothetical protein
MYDRENNSDILTEKLPLFGKVPLVFYLPPDTDQETIDLIKINGGDVSKIVECFSY